MDIKTGQNHVDKLFMVIDAGVIANPRTASWQIDGGNTPEKGYTVSEEMRYDEAG